MRIIALAALTLLLTGCVPADPIVTPVPVPSATPLFATDADALKAAEDAYAAYLKVSDQILADGGADPDRIDAVATPAVAKSDGVSFAKYRAQGLHAVGDIQFSGASLESYTPTAYESVVRIYVCVDVSETDVVDTGGRSVIDPGRQAVTPFEIAFNPEPGSSSLKVSSHDAWTGKDFCK
ncbi:MAG: hypothetical protein V4479_12525 [Actinomycetota bacterium]